MSVESWARRASGLLVPTMNFANPLGRFQPCAGSCCDDVPSDNCTSGIGPCSIVPTYLTFALSGILGDGIKCSDCSGANGTHIATFNNGIRPGCVWYVNLVGGFTCPANPPYPGRGSMGIFITVDGASPNFRMTLWESNYMFVYRKTGIAWDCMNWNETLANVPGLADECTNFPATVTVTVSGPP